MTPGMMEEVYRLFDRRGRTATALAKLGGDAGGGCGGSAGPRGAEEAAVAGPGEGAGVPGRASHGSDVERGGAGNRRYRKMQKTVYRVRTQRAIEGRLALDLQRERQGEAGSRRPRPSTRRGRHDTNDPVSLLQCRFSLQPESSRSRGGGRTCRRSLGSRAPVAMIFTPQSTVIATFFKTDAHLSGWSLIFL